MYCRKPMPASSKENKYRKQLEAGGSTLVKLKFKLTLALPRNTQQRAQRHGGGYCTTSIAQFLLRDFDCTTSVAQCLLHNLILRNLYCILSVAHFILHNLDCMKHALGSTRKYMYIHRYMRINAHHISKVHHGMIPIHIGARNA